MELIVYGIDSVYMYYLPTKRGGPTCKSKSLESDAPPILDGNEKEGKSILGNISGARTPKKPTRIAPLMKS